MVCRNLKFPLFGCNPSRRGPNIPSETRRSEKNHKSIGMGSVLCADFHAVMVRQQVGGNVMKQIKAAMCVFGPVLALAGPAVADATPSLTVVELFQSQGCSDCPPANANVMALSDRTDLLTLSFGVTYWDNLGWKDTFASPQYTARQWDYAHALGHSEVYTPQVVVNGRADIVGRDRKALEALITRETNRSGPQLQLAQGAAKIGVGRPGKHDVWLVRFNPRIENVPIARGENGGITLPHRNVVKQLIKIGSWNGTPATYNLPAAAQPGLREAVLVQSGPGGAIVAAAHD